MKENKCAFYLKINRNEGYTIRNLRHWLELINEYAGTVDYYIICDSEILKEKVIAEFAEQYSGIQDTIMECIITDETSYIVKNVTNERWKMAGYAHVTTFAHARDNGYDSFWNIDADDTRFCLSPKRSRELLLEAERYAIENKIDCFSLDMHTSLIKSGKHWSFGVTYTNNKVDWMQAMKEVCRDDISQEDQWPNIDRFFRYIRNNTSTAIIESFYVENLKFIHYSNDFFWRLNVSALFHWKEGLLTLPILYYGVGLHDDNAQMLIDPIVKKLDINITDEETTVSMLKACNSPSFYLRNSI